MLADKKGPSRTKNHEASTFNLLFDESNGSITLSLNFHLKVHSDKQIG